MKKGSWYFEIQILMFVIMWKHDLNHIPQDPTGFTWGRLHIWRDSQWLNHGFGEVLSELWDVLVHGQKKEFLKESFSRWIRHFKVIIKNSRWGIFVTSTHAYLRLFHAGFHISHSTNNQMDSEMYRFYWDRKAIKTFPDIDRVGGYYNTIGNGHVEALSKKSTVAMYSESDISTMWDSWPFFNGFIGVSCGRCGRKANILATTSAWECECGRDNFIDSWDFPQPHNKPHMGPNFRTILAGYTNSKKFKSSHPEMKVKTIGGGGWGE